MKTILVAAIVIVVIFTGRAEPAAATDATLRSTVTYRTKLFDQGLRQLLAANRQIQSGSRTAGAERMLAVVADMDANMQVAKALVTSDRGSTAQGRTARQLLIPAFAALAAFARLEAQFAEAVLANSPSYVWLRITRQAGAKQAQGYALINRARRLLRQ